MKVSVVALAGLLVFGGVAVAKDANTNSTTQTVASPKPPTGTNATVVSPGISASLPISAPRVGPNSTGIINSTSFDESFAR